MPPPCHSDHVLEQLCSQRQWGFLCDCLVSVGDTYFRAHKAVLSACSSFFRMMFTQSTTRGEQRVDLSQSSISAQNFDLILQFMYMGRINANSLQFSELKAAMQQLQMYFVPDSVEDLVRVQGPGSGTRLMFGVRMFPTRPCLRPGSEPETTTGNSRPISVEDVPLVVAPPAGSDPVPDQPCDLRKTLRKNSERLKDRPRFGRTFTCDDCGFVFSCEKLLIEHILTCTNRKNVPQTRDQNQVQTHTDSESSKSDTSESRFKTEDDWTGTRQDLGCDPGPSVVTVKTEPESRGLSEAEMEPESGPDKNQNSPKRIKLEPGLDQEETPDQDSRCELCGLELKDGDLSAHYLSDHVTHICACGRCGQVLIKGLQLQEHAQRCAENEENHKENQHIPTVATNHRENPQNLEENHQDHPEENPDEDSEDDDQEDTLMDTCHLLDNNSGVSLAGLPPAAFQLDEPRRRHFCGICGRGFFQRCHLREHYTVHTKHKQFTCLTCGKGFLRQRQLRLHQDMHRGVARYVCPVCDQGTFLKHDHVRHMISHLSPGETICQVCFQMFPGAEQLEQHLEVHLYVCSVCGEKFRLRKDMRTHYNNTHQSGRRTERL